jgi:hypothetical protein
MEVNHLDNLAVSSEEFLVSVEAQLSGQQCLPA